jgi:hypothetical protein
LEFILHPQKTQKPLISQGLLEMEREKRLESIDQKSDVPGSNSLSNIPNSQDSQIGAPELHRPEIRASERQMETGNDHASLKQNPAETSSDLREVINNWLNLNPAIKEAILSIVRSAIPTGPVESVSACRTAADIKPSIVPRV